MKVTLSSSLSSRDRYGDSFAIWMEVKGSLSGKLQDRLIRPEPWFVWLERIAFDRVGRHHDPCFRL